MYRLVFWTIYLVFLVASTAALAELGLRALHIYDPNLMFFNSPNYNRFRGKPHAPDWEFRLNSHGFKDVEFSEEKPEGTYRILGIGDSFVFGVVPYRHNFLTLLEKKLNQTQKAVQRGSIEILNMGIPGIDPTHYVSILINEGLAFRPDAVLLHFFIGNDFETTYVEKYEPDWYLVNVLKFLRVAIENKPNVGRQIHGKARYVDDIPTFDREPFLRIEHHRSRVVYHPRKPELSEQMRVAIEHLERVKAICDKSGIELLVVLIPDEVQVNVKLRTEIVRRAGWNPEQVDFSYPNRELVEKLSDRGIRVLDLLEPFQEESKEQDLYRVQDTHWNIPGNRLAAIEMAGPVLELVREGRTK